jgi:hypothetical protein
MPVPLPYGEDEDVRVVAGSPLDYAALVHTAV